MDVLIRCAFLVYVGEDCDKIQYYAALAVCNSLSIYFKRADIEEMVRLNIVNDLAVIMMLRVNEVRHTLRALSTPFIFGK